MVFCNYHSLRIENTNTYFQVYLNNFNLSIIDFSNCIKIDSTYSNYYSNRADAYFALEDYENALNDLTDLNDLNDFNDLNDLIGPGRARHFNDLNDLDDLNELNELNDLND